MPVKSSGSLSITTDIVGEFGGTTPHSISEYVRGGSLVPDGPSANDDIPTTTSSIQWSDYYGSVNEINLSDVVTPTTINGQSALKEITVSTYISSGGSLVIPTDWWIWSDSTSTAALIIDIPCTITNNGYIIGRGGNGGGGSGGAGGPAIKINSGVSGVTIINNSGYYIAGGGGGGASAGHDGYAGGGGGGAGGGIGGGNTNASAALNAVGANGNGAQGGGAGGGAGAFDYDGSDRFSGTGGNGGRVLPGSGGSGGTFGGGYFGGNGGSAGNAATAPYSIQGAGGGGGWGASGANGGQFGKGSGGAGGKAIDDSGETYSLTNNGTIYGAT